MLLISSSVPEGAINKGFENIREPDYISGSLIEIWSVQADVKIVPRHEISNNVVCATSKASDQPAHKRSLIRAFASRLNIL